MGRNWRHSLPAFVRGESTTPKLFPQANTVSSASNANTVLILDRPEAWLNKDNQSSTVLPVVDANKGSAPSQGSKDTGEGKTPNSACSNGAASPRVFSPVTSQPSSQEATQGSNVKYEPGSRNGKASGSNSYAIDNSEPNRKDLNQENAALPGTIISPHTSHDTRELLSLAPQPSGPSYPASSRKEKSEQESDGDGKIGRVPSKDSMITEQDNKGPAKAETLQDDSSQAKEETLQEDADRKTNEKASSSQSKIETQEGDFHDDWELGEMFAEGTSSVVHRTMRKGASSSSTSNTGAVMKISRPGKESELVKEAKFLQHLGRHPHVVELMGFYHSKQHGTALVLELLEGGEVLQLVEQPCSEMHIRIVAIQVCQALGFIHSQGIVHRDIKAENIVLSGRGGEVKIVDFGLAGFEDDEQAMMTRCGSPGYIAPEVIEGSRCSFVADIFGLGVVVYLLIAGRLPFRGKTPTDVLRRNLRCQVKFEDDIWFGLTECRAFVETLIVKDPAARPAAVDVWRHPWFACLIDQE